MKRNSNSYLVASALFLVLAFLFLGEAEAQTQLFGLNAAGDLGAGVRFLQGNRSSSKFNEYRDIHSGLFLDRFFLQLENKEATHFLQFQGENFIREDQRYLLEGGKYGMYTLEFQWDQIPHVFSNTGRTLFEKQGKGTFALPDIIQTTLEGAAPADQPGLVRDFLNGAHHTDLKLRRDAASLDARLTPTPEWDIRFKYSNEREKGSRPLGTTFEFTNVVELPEPINYRTNTLAASAEKAGKNWVLKLGYRGSIFENDTTTLIWDNPLRITDAVDNPSRGRMPLYPDNQAHNVYISGALNLPHATRLMVAISRGWMLQDEKILPFTINSAVDAPPVPRRSLDGQIITSLVNLVLNSRPLTGLSFNARYRFYDLDNNTPRVRLPGGVLTDLDFEAETLRSVPYEYNKHNAGIDLTWQIINPISWMVGWEWERWNRRFLQVKRSDEHTAKTALDIKPWDWLLLRTSYGISHRDAEKYDTNATERALSGEESEQLPLLRKFHQADRRRNKVEFLAQVTPLDTLTFSGSFSLLNDDFTSTKFGLRSSNTNALSFDVTYSPNSRLSFFADYTREDLFYKLTSRFRPVIADVIVDDPAEDWGSRNRDLVHTFGIGANGVVIPKKFDIDVVYSISNGRGTIRTTSAPGGTGVGEGTAVDFPTVLDRLQQLLVSFNYHLRSNLVTKLRYRYERLKEKDFATDVMQPWMGNFDPDAGTSMFLGARMPGYEAHTIAAVLVYKF